MTMKIDASQPFSMADGNNSFDIKEDQQNNGGYFKIFRQSFNLIYLRHKWFDERYWKAAFCSSPFNFIDKYPSIFLLYRTFLFVLALGDLIHGIISTQPIHEWIIYYTHLILLITFLAIVFQFLITYRAQFYRGNDIVPRNSLQYIHVTLVLVSLGSGLILSLTYWSVIYNPSKGIFQSKIILDHGILWFLLLVDVFFFTHLPIYMIDCVPIIFVSIIYGIFTLLVYLFQFEFSNNRIGYVYRAFNPSTSPLRVTILMFVFVFVAPICSTFILWNLFRLRRSIHIQWRSQGNDSELKVMDSIKT